MMTASAPIINPVLHGFHPDPSWMWHDGKAWLVTSSFGLVPGLPIYTSHDLAHWDYAGPAIDEDMGERLFLKYLESDNRGVFAPSIRMIGDAIVIVSTVTSIDRQRALAGGADPDELRRMCEAHGNFVLLSHDNGATWEGPHWVTGAVGNDPDVFVDEDGSAWWLASHQSYDKQWPYQSDIYLRSLDLTTWSLSGPEHVLWHGALEGAVWAEAPHLLRKDGHYYLFAAEAGTERQHAQSVARSDSLTDYFEGNPANPILSHRTLGGRFPVQNIGHSDIMQDGDGRWWGVCLGSRIVNGYSFMGREPFVFPVEWENGWPVFAPGTGLVPHITAIGNPRSGEGERQGSDQPTRSSQAQREPQPLRIPLHPDWLWTKVDHTDFTIIAAPEQTDEIRIRQDNDHYASLTFDQAAHTASATTYDNGESLTVWEGAYRGDRRYSIRLNGTILEFGEEPDESDNAHESEIRDGAVTLVTRTNDLPYDAISVGGYPIYRDHADDRLPHIRLLASCDAAFLSTEVSKGYLGCLAGLRPVTAK
ncbi:beta-xylosidase [Bifidobacterium hapali]|uniref:Beta-xylosidase n=1 Tax=Bifidobacterium hapali TaxID=1630172 RepID=A0A261FX47_9BIFI|nr:glycoside hydrolase family 43 protein [Bifidobacterium hapali]OZG63545.1 beta-xylosidase [Bifidobacterium hapali]